MAVLSESEKFEFDYKDMRPGETTPWVREDTNVTLSWHALCGSDIFAIHQLKDNDAWLMVSQDFDEYGIKEMPPFPKDPPEDEGREARLPTAVLDSDSRRLLGG